MRILASILLITSLSQITYAYNPFWFHRDKKLIKNLVEIDKYDSKKIEEFFIKKCDTTKLNLGFGWKMWTPGIGSGYISLLATFYYYHDSIVSYTIKPELPDEKGLIRRYKEWYKDFFVYNNAEILPFQNNKQAILAPLKEYKGNLKSQTVSSKILEYMTPNSGLVYGTYGGVGGELLQNRKEFLRINDSLTNEQIVFIMYSINPVSRYTAIEYYLKNKLELSSKAEIEDWIEKNIQEIPQLETLAGCYRESLDTRTLIEYFIKMKNE